LSGLSGLSLDGILDLETVVVDWQSAVHGRVHFAPRRWRATGNAPLAEERQGILTLDAEGALQPHSLRFLKSRRHCATRSNEGWRISAGKAKCGARRLERYRNLAGDHMEAALVIDPKIVLQRHQLGRQECGQALAIGA